MMKIHFFRSALLLLPLVAARDVSLYYAVSDLFDTHELAAREPAEQEMLQSVGLEHAHVEANHPAAHPDVAQIRAAMLGLTPLQPPVVPAMSTKMSGVTTQSPPLVPQAPQQHANGVAVRLQQQQQQQQQQKFSTDAFKPLPPRQPQPGGVKQTGGPPPRQQLRPNSAAISGQQQQQQQQQKQQLGGLRAAAIKQQPTTGVPRQAVGAFSVTPPTSPQGVPKFANAALQQGGLAQVQSRSMTSVDGDMLPQFDFVVSGFPKCGTTTLLKAFEAHPEIAMAGAEQCAVAAPSLPDPVVLKKLDETMLGMPTGDVSLKRAFKCPTAVYNYKAIIRMEKHSPGAKLVTGLRHPIKMMQSFYNYRIAEIYQRGMNGTEPIPGFLELLDDPSREPWKGVSMEAVRFEIFLQQLGKTHITLDDFATLAETDSYELAVKPNQFQIFLYEISQLEDTDEERSAVLRNELQTFLGLSTPLAPFGKENVNHVGASDAAPKETISICDSQYAHIRVTLLENAVATVAWLSEHFLESPDVIVANPEHFREILETWTVDPCLETALEDTVGAAELQI